MCPRGEFNLSQITSTVKAGIFAFWSTEDLEKKCNVNRVALKGVPVLRPFTSVEFYFFHSFLSRKMTN